MKDLRIHLLGGFEVWVGSRRVEPSEWYLRKPQSIVKLLALAPGHELQQGQIIDLLWPELDRAAASKILTKALLLLQRVLEPDLPVHPPSSYLRRAGDVIVLDPPGQLWIDVEMFVQAAETALLSRGPTDCDQALHLYAGDLLPDDRLEPWTMEPREHLKALRLALTSCRELLV